MKAFFKLVVCFVQLVIAIAQLVFLLLARPNDRRLLFKRLRDNHRAEMEIQAKIQRHGIKRRGRPWWRECWQEEKDEEEQETYQSSEN